MTRSDGLSIDSRTSCGVATLTVDCDTVDVRRQVVGGIDFRLDVELNLGRQVDTAVSGVTELSGKAVSDLALNGQGVVLRVRDNLIWDER